MIIFCSYLWRFLATSIGFILFGIGGLLIPLFLFPLSNCFIKSKPNRVLFARNTIRASFSLFVQFLKTCHVIDYKFIAFDKISLNKNTILVANHPSLLNCTCIVKGQLLHNFFLKNIVKAADYVPNNSSSDILIDLCKAKLSERDHLLIFPEGTRTTYPKPLKLQRGAANIALRTNRDIQLIHISLNAPLLTKEIKWYKVPPKKPTFILMAGDKIDISQYLNSNKSINIAARELTDRLENSLQKNL